MFTLYLTLDQAVWLKSHLEEAAENYEEYATNDMKWDEFDLDTVEENMRNALIAQEIADSI